MNSERDDYDIFLDDWVPSELLEHATLPSNLNDPLAQERLLADSTGAADLTRASFVVGPKVMCEREEQLRKYEFFKRHQKSWSVDFRDRVLSEGVDEKKFDLFVYQFATQWVDGKSRRQDSPEMMAIKASIQHHDKEYHAKYAGRFVLNPVGSDVVPLFAAWEMEVIFTANESLLETYIPNYIAELGDDFNGSINNLYLRRGVFMPTAPGKLREELNYLSSYSFALTPVEQFAKTWTKKTKNTGVPSIFSAPLPALQTRVVAFAPFIQGMDLGQLELVVAPPIQPIQLISQGKRGEIYDFEFK
jgi:hypothetical protein